MEQSDLKVFLDTNILLDVISTPDRPCAQASRIIVQAIRSGYFKGVMTTQSIVDAAYILSNNAGYPADKFGELVLSLMGFINIRAIGQPDIREAILHPTNDLEDDAQCALAEAEGCDIVLTSDRKFLRRNTPSGMLFLHPEEFLNQIRG